MIIYIVIFLLFIVLVYSIERMSRAIVNNTTSGKTKLRGKNVQYCRKCGEEMDGRAEFCPSCGTPTSRKMYSTLDTTEKRDAQPIQNIAVENQTTEPEASVFVPEYDAPHKSTESAETKKLSPARVRTLIITAVVAVAMLVGYFIVGSVAYNDAVEAAMSRKKDYNLEYYGSASFFVVKKFGLSFVFRLNDGKIENSSKSEIPEYAREDQMNSNVVYYQVYNEDDMKNIAFPLACDMLSLYENKKQKSVSDGSVIELNYPGTDQIPFKGKVYYRIENDKVDPEPVTKDDIPKNYTKYTKIFDEAGYGNVTLYLAKKRK